MQSNRYNRVRELFDSALDLPEPERIAYVRAQAGDEAIATEVIRLLGYGAQAKLQTQQPLQLLADSENQALSAGRRMGKYVLFDVIGEGGMGQVYRARRVDDTEQWVALKVMRSGFLATGNEERFRAERQILARLSHPGIAHFIDTDIDESGNTYVVMELVQGQPLLAYADSQNLGTNNRIQLFRQLLSAVSYAHQQFIIHRDIKSANVLVRSDGVVKLLDFGIAKLIADDANRTGTSDRLYTPLSAAPEQIRGLPCGAATDVYALGVLLYELISGSPIFDPEGKTPGEFERLVLTVPPPEMRSRLKPGAAKRDIPVDLERIVAKALRKEPERRYQSVEQFDADLGRLLDNEPVSVADNTWLYRFQKFLARNRVATGFAVLAAVATLIGLLVALSQYEQILSERDRANLALNAMKQAFISADPSGESGGDTSARQILEQSIQVLMPLVKQGNHQSAELAATLIEVQISMGLIQDAVQTRSALSDDMVVSLPRLCLLTARLLTEQQKIPEASQQLSSCVARQPNDKTLERLVRARLATKMLDFPKAISLWSKLAQEYPVDQPEWVYAEQQLADARSELGRFEEAVKGLQDAKARVAKRLPDSHPVFVQLDLARMRVLLMAGKFGEMATSGRALLTDLLPRYGERSALIGRVASMVAVSLARLGDTREALAYHEQALRSFRAVFGPDHRLTLRMDFNLILARIEVAPHDKRVRETFEDILVRSDQDALATFREFVAIEYAKWLVNQGETTTAFNVLSALSEPPRRFNATDSKINYDYQVWLTYAYWANRCAVDPSETFTTEQACRLPPTTFSSTCLHARDALCGAGTRDIQSATFH